MKKIISVLLLSFTICFSQISFAYASDISVTLDGAKISFDVPPINVNDRVLVPFRAIGEAMGATVDWNAASREVTLARGDRYVRLMIGSATMQYGQKFSTNFFSSEIYVMDTPAQIINDRTFVPVRAIAEGLGVSVGWSVSTVTLTTQPTVPVPAVIQSKDDLIAALTDKIRSGQRDFTLTVKNYSDSVYNISLFDYFNCVDSYSAPPTMKGLDATIEYQIDYKSSYAVAGAVRRQSASGLTDDENNLYLIATAQLAAGDIGDPSMSAYDNELAVHDDMMERAFYSGMASDSLSDAFLMFMDVLGVPCETITGRDGGASASWNRVKLDSCYYLVDAAMDAQNTAKNGMLCRDYFNVTDEVMNREHQPDTNDGRVSNSVYYNYFYYNGLTVNSQAGFNALVQKAVGGKQPSLSFICVGIAPTDLDLSTIFNYYSDTFSYSINSACGVVNIGF